MIITIDGPIATGKSTIAKTLAKELGYIYFDTGAMYRCLTYGLLKNSVNIQDKEALKKYLDLFKFDMKVKLGEKHYYVDKEDITDKIRGADVTAHVSEISAIKEVREKLVAMQKQLSVGVNAVFEGRDMGTVVFPDAQVKIFLAGNPEIRARRRFAELKAKFPEDTKDLTLEQTFQEITDRDFYDMTRENSPLRQAPDAYVIDTSELSIQDVVYLILEYKDSLKAKKA